MYLPKAQLTKLLFLFILFSTIIQTESCCICLKKENLMTCLKLFITRGIDSNEEHICGCNITLSRLAIAVKDRVYSAFNVTNFFTCTCEGKLDELKNLMTGKENGKTDPDKLEETENTMDGKEKGKTGPKKMDTKGDKAGEKKSFRRGMRSFRFFQSEEDNSSPKAAKKKEAIVDTKEQTPATKDAVKAEVKKKEVPMEKTTDPKDAVKKEVEKKEMEKTDPKETGWFRTKFTKKETNPNELFKVGMELSVVKPETKKPVTEKPPVKKAMKKKPAQFVMEEDDKKMKKAVGNKVMFEMDEPIEEPKPMFKKLYDKLGSIKNATLGTGKNKTKPEEPHPALKNLIQHMESSPFGVQTNLTVKLKKPDTHLPILEPLIKHMSNDSDLQKNFSLNLHKANYNATHLPELQKLLQRLADSQANKDITLKVIKSGFNESDETLLQRLYQKIAQPIDNLNKTVNIRIETRLDDSTAHKNITIYIDNLEDKVFVKPVKKKRLPSSYSQDSPQKAKGSPGKFTIEDPSPAKSKHLSTMKSNWPFLAHFKMCPVRASCDGLFYGGTRINDNWVLTSGQIFTVVQCRKDIKVLWDVYELGTDDKIYKTLKYKGYPECNCDNSDVIVGCKDVGLIKVKFGKNKKVKYPNISTKSLKIGTVCKTVRWDDRDAITLVEESETIVDLNQCIESINHITQLDSFNISSDCPYICTKLKGGSGPPTSRIIGAPLVYNGEVYGVSTGDYFQEYTLWLPVGKYLNWIENTMSKDDEDEE